MQGDGRNGTIAFGEFELDTVLFELRRNGAPVAVEPQTFSLLAYLLANRDRLVTRDDLAAAIWQGRAVSDWAVSAAVRAARKALGDDRSPRRFIRTVHGRGFRFIGADAASTVANGTGSPPAVAVLPFAEPDTDGAGYLGDGIAEDLITDLGAVRGLTVASRAASHRFRDGRSEDADIGARLGVTHVVAGSVRRHGSALRINARLIETATGRQVWANRFDGSDNDIFALQDRIGAQIVAALRLHFNAGRPSRGTNSACAYEFCLKGRSEYYRYTPPHMAEALRHFENATAIDPGYAEAWAYQSYCRTATHVFAWPGSDEDLLPAIALAEKAVALAPASAIPHARLGWVLGYVDRPGEAVASFERAIACDRRNAEAWLAYGETLNRLARPAEALPILDKAFAIDSFVPPSWAFTRGHSHLLLGECDKALDCFLPVLERVPGFVPARVQLVRAYADIGRPADAERTVAEIDEIAPRYRRMNAGRMFPYPDREQRRRLLSTLEAAGMAA